MTKYREIIRLAQPHLKLSQEKIATSCNASKGTVNKVLKAAKEHQLSWPLPESYTDQVIEGILFPEKKQRSIESERREPDYEYIRRELLRNGVNKKLLWTEMPHIRWECFIDADSKMDEFHEIPTIFIDDFLKKYEGGWIVMSSRIWRKEMVEKLIHGGVPESKIINIGESAAQLWKAQYFDLEYLPSKRTIACT